jgi:hypothetical protein
MGQDGGARLRLYDQAGNRIADSWNGAAPTYEMRDPDAETVPCAISAGSSTTFSTRSWALRSRRRSIHARRDRVAAWPEAARAVGDPAASRPT